MSPDYRQIILRQLLSNLVQKPKVFVSYHHANDQVYYDQFSALFSEVYDIITDRSVDRIFRSNDVQYQRARIRKKYIKGTSLTVVLCGTESWKRKFIDWEICATLNMRHALLGIVLPSQPRNRWNQYWWPDRLSDNLRTGYAHWIYWTEDPDTLKVAIDAARLRSRKTNLIDNSRPTMKRNLP